MSENPIHFEIELLDQLERYRQTKANTPDGYKATPSPALQALINDIEAVGAIMVLKDRVMWYDPKKNGPLVGKKCDAVVSDEVSDDGRCES